MLKHNKKCKYNARGARNFWHLLGIITLIMNIIFIIFTFHTDIVFISCLTLGLSAIMIIMSFEKYPEAPWYMEERKERDK